MVYVVYISIYLEIYLFNDTYIRHQKKYRDNDHQNVSSFLLCIHLYAHLKEKIKVKHLIDTL